MSTSSPVPMRLRWARLRFQIIGQLLAAPPEAGELEERLGALAHQKWSHPSTGELVQFGFSTIERWYYLARNEPLDPVKALERKVHALAGQHPSVSQSVRVAIRTQYQQHPTWSYQLHYDNLVALRQQQPELGALPSYPSLRRWMKSEGLFRRKRKGKRKREDDAATTFEPREQRSFEASQVHALWHCDYHEGSRKVLLPTAKWEVPVLLGILDDHSRLCCHLQWYLVESAETLVHGLSQAIQKRGLCRKLLSDNGGAMIAAETEEGLSLLGIVHSTTLPYSPEQNAKQEVFWAQVEGRLMAMLEGEPELTLELLNRATQAWVELEYNRKPHDEIGCAPLERYLQGPCAGRPSPDSESLRHAFRLTAQRTQRRSDGTVSIEGRRFELPSRFRTLLRPTVRYARWDLSSVDLVDPRSGKLLCVLLPLDKQKNAESRRRPLEPLPTEIPEPTTPSGIAPLLRQLMAEHAATGLPPAYLPLPRHPDPDADDSSNQESSP